MIANDQELRVALERVAQFQAQVAHLRNTETNASNYHAAVSGYLAEIDRMQLEVREYLSLHPREVTAALLRAPVWASGVGSCIPAGCWILVASKA